MGLLNIIGSMCVRFVLIHLTFYSPDFIPGVKYVECKWCDSNKYRVKQVFKMFVENKLISYTYIYNYRQLLEHY